MAVNFPSDSVELNKPSRNSTWVQSISQIIGRTEASTESKMRTILSCDVKSGKPALFVPPDMAILQPNSLRYLHTFARANSLRLVEDRRRVEIQPIVEQRYSKPPMIAASLSMLLKQTGLGEKPKKLSHPHRLNADSTHIPIARLINMAAFAAPSSKRIVLLPNRMMVDVLNNDTQPIAAYACKLISSDTTTVLSLFESPKFKAIGYSAGNQYILHVCLAGGPLRNPTLWAHLHTLTRTDFRFQLFSDPQSANDFGLFHTTFYMDMADDAPPWWLTMNSDTHLTAINDPGFMLHQKTG